MPTKSKNYIKWQVPEYRIPQRSNTWYIATLAIAILLLLTCFFTIRNWRLVWLGYDANFLFAVIIVIAGAIMITNEKREPQMIDIKLEPEGININTRFYDYDRLRHFSVIYKPKQSLKNLYIEFKNPVIPRLSIPLRSLDPLMVRNYLVRYLDEDLERTDPPLSEQLTKWLKL